MLAGVLIAESLRTGTTLDGVRLTVLKITRHAPIDVTADEPAVWTNIDFEANDADADTLAQALAGCLDAGPGWYADFRSESETFVVFAGKIFRYPRGEVKGRAKAQDYGRQLGVPESQLDWPV